MWVRRWAYELRWEPGLPGPARVRSGVVDTVAQLRAVVEWARANPRVLRCSYEPVDALAGDPPDLCPAGHPLDGTVQSAVKLSRDVRAVACRACPSHVAYRCPECRAVAWHPVPGPDCGPPDGERDDDRRARQSHGAR